MQRVIMSIAVALVGFTTLTSQALAEVFNGWRGNATGLWLEGSPPLVWHRTPHGAMRDLRAQADRPTGEAAGDARALKKACSAIGW